MAASALISIGLFCGGCGGQDQAPRAAANERAAKTDSYYVKVLFEFRDAARADVTYDAYGYAEAGLPDAQRAAIVAFCVVVTRAAPTASSAEMLSDPAYFSDRVVNEAKPEAGAASMETVRRAVDKLQAIIRPRSLTDALVKSYAKACY